MKTKLITKIFITTFLCLTVFSCDTTEPGGGDANLNPKLHSVFYWGYQYPGPKIPNIGVNEGPPIQNPV